MSELVVISGAVIVWGSVIVRVKVSESVPAEFSASMVIAYTPAASGVPESTPAELRVRPGISPFRMLHVIGVVPEAVNAAVYARDVVPSGRYVVVIAGFMADTMELPMTFRVKVDDAEPAELEASTVKSNTPV